MPDAPEKDLSIQNDFFNQVRKSHGRVTIFLANGKRLVGRIKAFDRFTVLLDAGGGTQEMIFKHAIATISTISSASRPGQLEAPPADSRAVQGAPSAPATPVPGTTPK